MYVEDWFINLYLIRYGDSAMQSNCIFLVHFAPLSYYNFVLATPSTRITSRAHATILPCKTEVPPSFRFLQPSVVLFYCKKDSLSDRNSWIQLPSPHTHGTCSQYRYAHTRNRVPVDLWVPLIAWPFIGSQC